MPIILLIFWNLPKSIREIMTRRRFRVSRMPRIKKMYVIHLRKGIQGCRTNGEKNVHAYNIMSVNNFVILLSL